VRFPALLSAAVVTALSFGVAQQLHSQNPAPVAVQLPSGAYMLVVAATDSVPSGLVGEWQFVFDTAGVYHLVRNGNARVTGTYQIRGDTLQLVDTGGNMACLGTSASQPGLYTWKLGPDGLTLVAVNDWCRGRLRMTTMHPLVIVKPN
jgi:hypothetical protein